jgi:hypothetical protein
MVLLKSRKQEWRRSLAQGPCRSLMKAILGTNFYVPSASAGLGTEDRCAIAPYPGAVRWPVD